MSGAVVDGRLTFTYTASARFVMVAGRTIMRIIHT